MEDDYTPVKIPTELAKHIDEFIQGNPKFRTRAGFVRYVISHYIDNDIKTILRNTAQETGSGGKEEMV
jgi:metal-responsive CopG/Arc/MetJ family transcriptional regulator